jgi:hypothetical protein
MERKKGPPIIQQPELDSRRGMPLKPGAMGWRSLPDWRSPRDWRCLTDSVRHCTDCPADRRSRRCRERWEQSAPPTLRFGNDFAADAVPCCFSHVKTRIELTTARPPGGPSSVPGSERGSQRHDTSSTMQLCGDDSIRANRQRVAREMVTKPDAKSVASRRE